jgi:hypothetical protein
MNHRTPDHTLTVRASVVANASTSAAGVVCVSDSASVGISASVSVVIGA